jgi:hypothetical protein
MHDDENAVHARERSGATRKMSSRELRALHRQSCRMLDLSMQSTKNVQYLMCRGGLNMSTTRQSTRALQVIEDGDRLH